VNTSRTLTRVEVRVRPELPDARANAVAAAAKAAGLHPRLVRHTKVYLIEGLAEHQRQAVLGSLLADPVVEVGMIGAAPASGPVIEILPLPGVMDPAALSVQEAIRDLTGAETRVATGVRYDFEGVSGDEALEFARTNLANPVIHQIHAAPFLPDRLPEGRPAEFRVVRVALRAMRDEELLSLSRTAHLFLSLGEMQAIRAHFEALGRDPTDIELETIAQTWSEHCVHKTLKSRVVYREDGEVPMASRSAAGMSGGGSWAEHPAGSPSPEAGGRSRIMGVSFEFTPSGRAAEHVERRTIRPPEGESPSSSPEEQRAPGGDGSKPWALRAGHVVHPDGSVEIDNLLKCTVAAATFDLMADGVDWTLSVFRDNSGVIALDDEYGVCIKVETHNRPSAIEPYGGAATGIGGCIRDILGTGLGARPIASTDVFCVGEPDARPEHIPPGTLHPRRILTDVVAGVRDYGNRMGIPTVAGAVHFDRRYIGNPLVFCGCVGLIPRGFVEGKARPGDVIVALGGRTGRDGIHGATFSSAELEGTHADEFSHAVQIGNAIEEKRLLDTILRARDAGPLYHAITDCGAGGFSSAVGEMGRELGAEVHLERAPLKYAGLTYTDIWISEAQERMVLAVPRENLDALRSICQEEHVELAELGTFGTPGAELVLRYHGQEVGRLSMQFLHEGLPMPTRQARWPRTCKPGVQARAAPTVQDALLRLLAHPSIASKHWIIRQYDHEVQGATVVKPLVGPAQIGPSDGTVLEPRPGTGRGVAIACGLAVGVGDPARGGDPYQMALAGVDECVRNLVCAGANPRRIAILDNFCWPSCDNPVHMGALVRACEGCYDAALAYRTPFVSGKDSLNNQLRYTDPRTGEETLIEIPYTLLITGIGLVENLARCVTMDAKQPGNLLVLVGTSDGGMGGSVYQSLFGQPPARDEDWARVPRVDLRAGPATAGAVAQAIADGLVASAHDCSDGGLLVAIAEMLIATAPPPPEANPEGRSALAALLVDRRATPPPLGAEVSIVDDLLEEEQLAFAEGPSRYLLEVPEKNLSALKTILRDFGGMPLAIVGKLNTSGQLVWRKHSVDVPVSDLVRAWRGTLDW
jgi:phosphoribosylformylglycinamidine synthase II